MKVIFLEGEAQFQPRPLLFPAELIQYHYNFMFITVGIIMRKCQKVERLNEFQTIFQKKFKENITFDNLTRHKKSGLHSLSLWKYIFRKKL